MNRIGRRIIMCMILIAALAVIWNFVWSLTGRDGLRAVFV